MEEDINSDGEPAENENVDTSPQSRPPNSQKVMLQAFLSDSPDDNDKGEAGEEEDEDDEMGGQVSDTNDI